MSKKETFWIPYADLMTVLMVIFLFISLSYMGLVQFQKNQQDDIFKEYKQTKGQIYNELKKTFEKDIKKWDIEIDKDLSIRFVNERILFDFNSARIKPEFQQILSEFIPKYLSIILNPKYHDKISEIRIEGHTAAASSYIYSVELSQKRSNTVLNTFLNHAFYKNLSTSQKDRLQFWLTSNGLAYGRALDNNGDYIFDTNGVMSIKSRRVEFRIVTTSDKLVEKVLEQLNK